MLRSVAVALAATVLAGLAPLAPAAAVPRDAELHPSGVAEDVLAVRPAVSLAREVQGADPWRVQVVGSGQRPLEVALAVHLAVPGPDGRPTAGDVVPWATLPRERLALRPGDLAQLTIALAPPAQELPVAVVLVARAEGGEEPTALAARVLWPPAHEPAVRLARVPADEAGPPALVVADEAGPSVVDVRVRVRTWPLPASTTDHGPLVLLPGASRTLPLDERWMPWRPALRAVAAVDGAEVARLADGGPDRALLATASAAALAVAATAAVVLRRRRRT